MLGLGSQIKPHIEKRFSMPWSHPAPRMRELILAIRAIWASWADGSRLAFRGEFYRHTLMTPMFDPGPNPYGNPRIFLAAVGREDDRGGRRGGRRPAGPRVHHRALPARGHRARPRARPGRRPAGPAPTSQISYPGMVVTGADEAGFAAAARAVKTQLAFYGSTPAYRPVLELHGWGDLQTELNTLSKRGAWDDDGRSHRRRDAQHLRRGRRARRHRRSWSSSGSAGVVDRFNFYAPYPMEPERWAEVLAGFR